MGMFSFLKPQKKLAAENVRHIRQELLSVRQELEGFPANIGLTRQSYRNRFIRRFAELRNRHDEMLLRCHQLRSSADAQKMDKATQGLKREIQQFSYLLNNHIAEFREERNSQRKNPLGLMPG